MKKMLLAAVAITGLALAAAPADAAGCLSGAAVGGVAGHVAGHHGALGAAAGCAIGHHEAVKQERQDARYNNRGDGPNNGYAAPNQQGAPNR